VIPAGVTLTFNDPVDTWTGMGIQVFGTLMYLAAAAVNINASVTVKSGGLFRVDSDGSLGTTAGCGHTLTIDTGGKVDLFTGKTLSICGSPILTNGGVCSLYLLGPPPYCEPADGFGGPSAFDEDGIHLTLPVKLSYFHVKIKNESALLEWATTSEDNFYKFFIERSTDGLSFQTIGEVAGQVFNIDNVESKYSFVGLAPMVGTNYYRLKAVDVNNNDEHFHGRAVKINGSEKLGVYPNPSNGESISFVLNYSHQESDRIVVIDQLGVEVYNGAAPGSENSIVFQNPLQPGFYMLRYISNDFEQVTRVMVRRL
jgi:hypothetical protein